MQTLTFINSAFLILELIIIVLLARQIGILLNRIKPVGARVNEAEGPRTGENISTFVTDYAFYADGKYRLYVFGAGECGICNLVREAVKDLAPHWQQEAEFYLVYDAPKGEAQTTPIREAPHVHYFESHSLRKELGIHGVPYAVLTDSSDIVIGKGLVNTVEHVESILNLIQTKEPAIAN